MRPRIKICGITNEADAMLAANMGADAIGFVFYEGSKRYVPYEKAKEIIRKLPPMLVKVGVFVHDKWERIMEIRDYCKLDRVQVYADNENEGLHKKIIPEITIMAYRIRDEKDIERAKESIAFPLLDSFHHGAFGGTGKRFEWRLLSEFNRPCIVAGGINRDTLDEVLKVNPYAIDLASGVESASGIKDHTKLAEIFKRVKG